MKPISTRPGSGVAGPASSVLYPVIELVYSVMPNVLAFQPSQRTMFLTLIPSLGPNFPVSHLFVFSQYGNSESFLPENRPYEIVC